MQRFKISGFFIGFFLVLVSLGLAREAASLLLALFFHETGHIIAAKLLGCKVEQLSIQPLGGYLKIDQLIEVLPQTESRIALAGPVANLLAVAVLTALVPPGQHAFSSALIKANLMLMAFNLLPALPLDGGRILRARLSIWLPFYRATSIVIASGVICGLLLLAWGAYGVMHRIINPTVIAAGVFLLYNAYVEKKHLLVPLIRYVLHREARLRKTKFAAAQTLVAAPGVRVNEVLKFIRPQKYYQISVLDEGYKVSGTLTEHQLLKQILAGTGQRSLLEVVEAERQESH